MNAVADFHQFSWRGGVEEGMKNYLYYSETSTTESHGTKHFSVIKRWKLYTYIICTGTIDIFHYKEDSV